MASEGIGPGRQENSRPVDELTIPAHQHIVNSVLPVHKEFFCAFHRLTRPEQESVIRTLGLLEAGTITSGMRPHKVGAWLSFSANMDLRIIASGGTASPTLVFVSHHDVAYEWASRRTPALTTGGVEIIRSSSLLPVTTPDTVETEMIPTILEELISSIDDPNRLLESIVELSPEWQEWMARVYIDLECPKPSPPQSSSLVWVPDSDSATIAALKAGRQQWQFFLHPNQRAVVEDWSSQSIAVVGGPGTGKSVALLRRLMDRRPAPGNCRVLLAYTESLVDELWSTLAELGVDTYTCVVLPAYFLDSKPPARARYIKKLPNTSLELIDGALVLLSGRGSPKLVEELLVDELQDVDDQLVSNLRLIIKGGVTRVTVAADVNQSIHRLNDDIVDSFVAECQATYNLDYCYRSTRQILKAASRADHELQEQFGLEEHRQYEIRAQVLAGPPVRFVCTKDFTTQLAECARVIEDLERRYEPAGLAVIYVQYFNPAFKGGSREEAALKNHPQLKNYYRFASLTKGREYEAGVLFISETFMGVEKPASSMRLRANTLYVSLTRFRDEVTVIYPKGCAIEGALAGINPGVVD